MQLRQPTTIEIIGLFAFVVMPLAAVGAFGMLTVVLWAVSDMTHYGVAMFALGLGLGFMLRPRRALNEEWDIRK